VDHARQEWPDGEVGHAVASPEVLELADHLVGGAHLDAVPGAGSVEVQEQGGTAVRLLAQRETLLRRRPAPSRGTPALGMSLP
jgi:hypothetical protein